MNETEIAVRLIEWDEDIIQGVSERLETSCERGARGRAVSLLTGASASLLFFGEREPDRLISHLDSGKPVIPGFPGVTVSISHSGATAAVSLSEILHGIDIELPRAVSRRIFRRVFSPEELAVCEALDGGQLSEYFFRAWTRKEALIKTGAVGLGSMHTVNVSENRIFLNGGEYFFDTMSPVLDINCTLSLCSRGSPAAIRAERADRRAQLRAASLLDRLYFDI